ncbi:MAG: Outer membrane protein assembly factor BamB [Anaerolineales bacterium]|nr:Outer membrane protein assembly factor BamB [Anaerolineales bacterium]
MKKRRFFFLILFLPTLLGCSPQPRALALNKDLSLAWTIQTDGAINHPPLIVGDIVLLAPAGAPLLALDLATGATKWTFAPPEGIWERAYASDGRRVFVGVKGGGLAALNVKNGKVIWQKELGINVQVPPFIDDGIVYASTAFVGPELTPDVHGRAKLFALDAQTGKEIWAFESDDYILQTAARNRETLFVGGNFYDPRPIDEGGHTRIYALDPATGAPLWKYESEDGFPKRLYATEETLVFVGYQDFMNGVDLATGKLGWRFDTGNWTPSFLGAENAIYFSSANTQVFAVNADTGESIWQFDIPAGTFNYLLDAPILLDGVLYFLTQQGNFFALDASSGQLLWQAETEVSTARTSPAVGNGWLIIGDIEGRLFGYR